MTDKKLWYLATPYTNFDYGLDLAFVEACKTAADLIKLGYSVFSPIVHSHTIAYHGKMDPTDHAMWMAIDAPFMERCDGLIVATIKGWSQSKGVRFEIDWFQKAGKPVRYFDPETSTLSSELLN